MGRLDGNDDIPTIQDTAFQPIAPSCNSIGCY